MSGFSRRKKRRAREPFAERQTIYWPFDWPEQWGRPSTATFVCVALFCGIALVVVGLVLLAALTSAIASIAALDFAAAIEMLLKVLVCSLGLFALGKVLVNVYLAYTMAAPNTDTEVEPKQPASLPSDSAWGADSLIPNSPQYDQAVRECREAIGEHYVARRVFAKEAERIGTLLLRIVRPKQAGQIDLAEIFEIRCGDAIIHYAVVTYCQSERTGKHVSQITCVGQIVVLPVNLELGRIWIRPEALTDMLGEWIASRDIDFSEHKHSAGITCCTPKTEAAVSLRVPDEVWQAIGACSNLVIAGDGSDWVIGREGGIEPTAAVGLVALGFEIAEAFARARQQQRAL